ncbi:MAG: hypothetical protein KDA77_00095 [Planctomycetaceae bacterium]|nr:hypothetical protein [Planctomycetaceae bacterium]
MSSGNSLNDSDAWVIDGITYQAVAVGKPRGGLVTIEIKYVQKKNTKLDRRTNY